MYAKITYDDNTLYWGHELRSYIMELDNYQVEQIAKTIMFDIQGYIAEHKVEYEAFKKAYEQNSTLKIK